MKNLTAKDIHNMSSKEALLLCIAHYKNIVKHKNKGYAAKRFIFIYKRKLVDPDNFSCACVLCEFSTGGTYPTGCNNCPMQGYWGVNKSKEAKHCMDLDSTYRLFENAEKGSAEAMLKALYYRLNILRKEERK